MSALDDILGALPADSISQQVGASPEEVRAAAAAVLPALLQRCREAGLTPVTLNDALPPRHAGMP